MKVLRSALRILLLLGGLVHGYAAIAVAVRLPGYRGEELLRACVALGSYLVWIIVADITYLQTKRESWERSWSVSNGMLFLGCSMLTAIVALPSSAFSFLSFCASAIAVAILYTFSAGALLVGLYTAAGCVIFLFRGAGEYALSTVVQSAVVIPASVYLKQVLHDREKQATLFDQARWAASKLSEVTMRLDSTIRAAEHRAAVNERTRVARLVHDSVGYTLTAIMVQLNALGELTEDLHTRESLLRLEKMVRKAHQEIRVSVTELRRVERPDTSTDWVERWDQLCNVFMDCTGIRIHTDLGNCSHVSSAVGEAVYRVMQESLTNAYRHGRATYVSVSMKIRHDIGFLLLKISDNGIGASGVRSGNGLRGIRERVLRLGGEVKWNTLPGRGFDIAVDIPLRQDEQVG